MNPIPPTPWHAASFDHCLRGSLPRLLAERLPLSGYHVAPGEDGQVRVTVTVDAAAAVYHLPAPTPDGVFHTPRGPRVVTPLVAHDDLATAAVACVGEQLATIVETRLGVAPADIPWDEALLRAWLPLDGWLAELLATAAPLDERNLLARLTHLRRIRVTAIGPDGPILLPGHWGRVCPVESPEGENLGRVLVLARGAGIAHGRILPAGAEPAEQLGPGAACIPFLHHDDGVRALMGANMMRQWLPPEAPEPALVVTGLEPGEPALWCGRNLLTGYLDVGADTHEDALVVSASAASRLGQQAPLEPGDKLSNRHGQKGVVSAIWPDAAMPRLADGTPLDLVVSHLGVQTRLNLGQLLEAVAGRLARAEGQAVAAPPYSGPSVDDLRQRLRAAGLPEDGMERLSLDGAALELPSTVGYVYWGKLYLRAAPALHSQPAGHAGERMGWLDHACVRESGCRAIPAEWGGLGSVARLAPGELAELLAAGEPPPLGPPTPWLAALTRRLAVLGIGVEIDSAGLHFGLREPDDALELAEPVPHPWHRDLLLTRLGPWSGDAWEATLAANARLARLRAEAAPDALLQPARGALASAIEALARRLVRREHLCAGDRVAYSGRAVIAPGGDLCWDQVGLPRDLAEPLFAPLLARSGETDLAAVMARHWLLVTRAPAVAASAHVALRPVLVPDRVIRLHALTLMMLNADFDGDQVAVMLPLTAATQAEAAQRLSIGAHLERDSGLLGSLLPPMSARWGLAWLSLTTAGRQQIAHLLGFELPDDGHLTRAGLLEAAAQIRLRDGVDGLMGTLDALTRLGFAAARRSGASLAPFAGTTRALPPQPQDDDRVAWAAYAEQLVECLRAVEDYANPDLGPQILAVKSGARGTWRFFERMLGGQLLPDGAAGLTPQRHSQIEGLSPEEYRLRLHSGRSALAMWLQSWTATCTSIREGAGPHGFGVLARACHSAQPGVIFARAALTGECDPLADAASRLFVGVADRG
ncbi:MAG: hypothetical protein HZB16_16775 [Armatimonadetes bacterium]|nr:hypothetical protein [Armatimonadota bacterium]